MIGKGAQYLTAAGFGRYRITAASLGSNLMFRMPWSLSGATKQAIMAAFGVDGTAVIAATNEYLNGIAASDKAKATALAGFINEDPMMVCSLGLEPTLTTLPAMPIRRAITDENCWIATGFYPTSTSGIEWDFELISNQNANSALFEIDAGSTGTQGFGLAIWDQKWVYAYNNGYNLQGTAATGVRYHYSQLRGVFKMTGSNGYVENVNRGQTATVIHLEMRFPGFNRNGSGGGRCLLKTPVLELSTDGVTLKRFIPCTNKNGMVDLVNMAFHPNQGTGTYTEDYILPDGTPWTPPTP